MDVKRWCLRIIVVLAVRYLNGFQVLRTDNPKYGEIRRPRRKKDPTGKKFTRTHKTKYGLLSENQDENTGY